MPLRSSLIFPMAAFAMMFQLISCNGPDVSSVSVPKTIRSTPVSLTKDSWGHRPGPRGFDTVVIDAGHGGKDPGASVAGIQEKKLALDTAKRLKKHLGRDFHVILLRDGDQFISLDQRASLGSHHNGSIFLSLHYNHGPSWVRGPETYYWRVDSHGLASRIQKNMERVSSREYKNAGLKRRRLRLTRNVKVPSVLIEVGYLSNRAERSQLASSKYREKMARAIASAVREQARSGDVGTGPKPKVLWSPVSRRGDVSKL